MPVIGAEEDVTRVDPASRHRGDLRGQIAPRRAFPDHRVHPLADPRHEVLGTGSLVTVARPADDVRAKRRPEIRRGIVSADDPTGRQRRRDFPMEPLVAGHHGGVIHHLAEADHSLPAHCLRHLVRADLGARCLQARSGRNAGGNLNVDPHRRCPRFIDHQTNAGQSENVRDLVRVDECSGRPARKDRRGEAPHGEHRALDVHVGIKEPGDEVSAARFHNGGVGTDHRSSVRAAIGDPAAENGDIRPVDDLARTDVHPSSVANNQSGRPPSSGNGRQIACHLLQRSSFGHSQALSAADSPLHEEAVDSTTSIHRIGVESPGPIRTRCPLVSVHAQSGHIC